ncbi:hypothetical protein WS79_29385 [Burkholderia territorii]|nr:hypothetical protein WS79_29385 [Burkholderia territorii]
MAYAAGNPFGVGLKFAARMLDNVDQSAANRMALGTASNDGFAHVAVRSKVGVRVERSSVQ